MIGERHVRVALTATDERVAAAAQRLKARPRLGGRRQRRSRDRHRRLAEQHADRALERDGLVHRAEPIARLAVRIEVTKTATGPDPPDAGPGDVAAP
jgi:hypothetical protein